MNDLFGLLDKHGGYNIVGHVRPDGDCVGSEVALSLIIRALGKGCSVIRNDIIPPDFAVFFDGVPCVSMGEIDGNLPLICVDCSDYERVGQGVQRVYDAAFLNIDHHISNNNFAQNNIVDGNAVSTTEILAEALIENKFTITKSIADALYLGIMTDTGRFAYAAASLGARTFRIAELLIDAGTNPNKIYSLAYENNTLQRYKLLERLLKNLEIFCDGRVCLSFVTESDFIETGATSLDTEGFSNYTRELKGVLVGCFLEVRKDSVKCSLRATDKSLRMDLLASLFGGGGHFCAAGFLKTGISTLNFVDDLKLVLCKHMEKFCNDYPPTR
ncbi:MAG: bifunctional oligoribonuclease/PAP phosphatase NrnA [Puniceicoccales bacterium]|jgi:phosphoesterase RecJ-like protein|nr:bifunctional oligoribonuclease/PAP phosphatase NrnA [Puniceicoccales bacterium]